MAHNSNEVIDRLAEELGIPPASMRTVLKSFEGKDITGFTDEDEEALRETVRENIRKVLGQRGGLKDFVRITPDVMRPALIASRRQILANQAISDKLKAFVEEHCLC